GGGQGAQTFLKEGHRSGTAESREPRGKAEKSGGIIARVPALRHHKVAMYDACFSRKSHMRFWNSTLAAGLLLASALAAAQTAGQTASQTYPTKPIRLLLPFARGASRPRRSLPR